VPVLKRMLGRATASAWIAGIVMFLGMAVLAYIQSFHATGSGQHTGFGFMIGAGLVAAGAMILPGVSGGYMFLLLGVYVPVLRGIDALTEALRAGDMDAATEPILTVVLPIAIGVVVGVVAVSNGLRWLLARCEKATLGALMGLLVGAVVGLWPFQADVPLDEVDLIKGQPVRSAGEALVYEATGEAVDPADYPAQPRWPASVGETAGSLGLIAAGFAFTAVVARLGREDEKGA